MKRSLTFSETILVGLLMFGLFFGAGNLIFPTMIGFMSGTNLWSSTTGFLLTAATLPAIGIVAAALSRNQDMVEMATPVCRSYALFYSIALYIAIGPAFAIPRNATVSFAIGIQPFLGGADTTVALGVFSAIFFIGVLLLSLKPAKAMTYIGRYLTPAFLAFLAILLAAVIFSPVGGYDFAPVAPYDTQAFNEGFFNGYQTMDALASVIFCLIVIEGVRSLGVTEPKRIAWETAKAGLFCVIAMAVIYAALTYMGGVSHNVLESASNGGQIFAFMSGYYFGPYGQMLIAAIVILACFKTSIGLVTAGAEFFNRIYSGISVTTYIYALTLVSFLVANVGLNAIIQGAVPVLFFLYPLTITLIALGLLYPFIKKSRPIYGMTTAFTLVAATFDLVKYSPEFISKSDWATSFVGIAQAYLPMYDLGFGWIIPAVAGFALGVVLHLVKGGSKEQAA